MGDDAVEVAFVVEDGWQGLGLGPMLLDAVMRAGRPAASDDSGRMSSPTTTAC